MIKYANRENDIFCFIEDVSCRKLKIPTFDAKIKNVFAMSGEKLTVKEENGFAEIIIEGACESVTVIKISMDRSISSIYESFNAKKYSAFSI